MGFLALLQVMTTLAAGSFLPSSRPGYVSGSADKPTTSLSSPTWTERRPG